MCIRDSNMTFAGQSFNSSQAAVTNTDTGSAAPAGGFLGGFDFNDIIALAVVWNGYNKK